MKIIFESKGSVSIMTPTPKFLETLPASWTENDKMVHVANKDLPTGTKYEIVESVPSDRAFRGAWEYQAGEAEKVSEDLSALFKLKYGHDLSASEQSEVEDFLAVKAKEKQEQVEKAKAAEAERLARQEAVPANLLEE